MSVSLGAGPLRMISPSDLIFGWRARLGTLDAYTGQAGVLQPTTLGIAPPHASRGLGTMLGGHGVPRFDQELAYGTTPRLLLERISTFDLEQVQFAWPLKVMPISIFLRLIPGWAAGTNTGISSFALQLGEPTAGGYIVVGRVNNTWLATRTRSGSSITTSFVESGTTVYPIDVLVTFSGTGQLALSTRDATGLIQVGTTTPTDAAMANQAEFWGNSIMYLLTGDLGGRFWYETIKIAREVQTFATMDLLS
jgi:hypothetical protein